MTPKSSWVLNMSLFCVWAAGGALAFDIEGVPPQVAFVWGFFVGSFLGWFYSVENVFFSLALPKGQEAELSGFYVYCTQILVSVGSHFAFPRCMSLSWMLTSLLSRDIFFEQGWLPPLIFTIMVENDVSQTYGVVTVLMFFPIAILLLLCAAPWREILEESGRLEDVGDGKSKELSTGDDKLENDGDKSSEDVDVEK